MFSHMPNFCEASTNNALTVKQRLPSTNWGSGLEEVQHSTRYSATDRHTHRQSAILLLFYMDCNDHIPTFPDIIKSIPEVSALKLASRI